MRRYFQWTLILTLAFALAVFTSPVGVANGDDDDDGNGDECDEDSPNDPCDGGGNGNGNGIPPSGSAEFVVGNFTCAGSPSLTFAGSTGIGMFSVSGAPVADPNSCVELGGALEGEATAAGCTSAGLVTDPSVALTFTCVGDRNAIVTTQGNLITTLVSYMPSAPMLLQQSTQTSLSNQGRQGRRR